jgi:hypothetical protein
MEKFDALEQSVLSFQPLDRSKVFWAKSSATMLIGPDAVVAFPCLLSLNPFGPIRLYRYRATALHPWSKVNEKLKK